jgi:hypothetical protein
MFPIVINTCELKVVADYQSRIMGRVSRFRINGRVIVGRFEKEGRNLDAIAE